MARIAVVKRFTTEPNAEDTFVRADSSTTLGTTTVGGFTWQPLGGTVYGISSNQAYPVSGATDKPVVVDVGSANIDASITISTFSASTEEALYFRVIDASNGWRLIRAGSTLRLQKRVAGVTTSVFNIAKSFSNGDTFRVRAIGNTINCYVNGIHQFSTTDTYNNTATMHGFGQATGNSGARFDNFILYY
jgi:hypothetical protein